MKRVWKTACWVALMLVLGVPGMRGQNQTLQELEQNASPTFKNAFDTYIYGYPLLMFGVTGRTATTIANPGDRLGGAPLNQFGKEPNLPNYTFTSVVLPSTSTLYASSFLNLQAGPIVLHIPSSGGRFFIMQMLDAWTNVSAQSPSSRQKSKPGDYLLVGPDYTGQIPSGFQDVIKMATNSMWIIGRIYTIGTDKDIDDIKANFYKDLTLIPLTNWISGTPFIAPADLPLDPIVDFITPPLNQVAGMDACAFFGAMGAMMQYNYPIPVQDDAILPELAAVGFVKQDMSRAYKPYDCTMDANNLATLQVGVAAARKFLSFAPTPLPTKTFWTMATTGIGMYGNNYLLRAEVAQSALGANNPADAVYGYTQKDGRGRNLNGTKSYHIHFGPPTDTSQGIPPIVPGGFWSLTIYDHLGKLVKNDDAIAKNINYNAIGGMMVQGHSACLNGDGSLDLYLQPTAPAGGIALCNWLPTPDTTDAYIAFLRMYWPSEEILSKEWIPPRIMPVN
jgi:hypothetical protein